MNVYYCTTLCNSFRTYSVPIKNLMDFEMNIISDDISTSIKHSFQVKKTLFEKKRDIWF